MLWFPTKGTPFMSGRETWEPIAREAAMREGIDVHIFLAMIEQESGWNEFAASADGAVGIMQIMPHAHPDVNAWNATESIFWAAKTIKKYRDERGNYDLALAAYNVGGPGTASWTAVPQWERYRYVDPILRRAAQLRALETPETAIPTATTTTPVISQTSTPVPPGISTPTPTPPLFGVVLLACLVINFAVKAR